MKPMDLFPGKTPIKFLGLPDLPEAILEPTLKIPQLGQKIFTKLARELSWSSGTLSAAAVSQMCPGVDLGLSPSFPPPGPSRGSRRPHQRENRQCTWIRPYKKTDLILPLSLPLCVHGLVSEPSGCGCCHRSHPQL